MNDPIMEELYRIRDKLCKKFNYDVHAIYEDIKARQETIKHRLVKFCSPEKAVGR